MNTSLQKCFGHIRRSGASVLRSLAVAAVLGGSSCLGTLSGAAATPLFLQCQEYFTATDMNLDAFVDPPAEGPVPPPPCSDSFGVANITVKHVRLPFSFPCGMTMFSGLEGHGFAEHSRDELLLKETQFFVANGRLPAVGLHIEIIPNPADPNFITAGSGYLQYLKAEVYVESTPPVADPGDYRIGAAVPPSPGVVIGKVPLNAAHVSPGTTGPNSLIVDVDSEIRAAQAYLAGTSSTDCTIGVRFYFEPPSYVWQIGAQIGSNIENRAQLILQ